VVANGAPYYRVTRIEQHQRGGYAPLPNTMQETVTVRWLGSDGKQREVAARPEEPVPNTFSGCVFYQINADGNTVTTFPHRHAGSRVSVLPWSTPASWEGTPGIPGLSGEN
jgi:hypothetical protein